MIKEKELQKAVVSNKLITHKATDLTIMSYDKNVHKLIIPTDLTQAEISDIIVLITFRYHKNIIQISGELVEDKIEIILPNEIRSLSGEFYIEIDINLTDNRQITFARYRANVVKSDIDSVDLEDAQEFYFELFDDFVQKVTDKSEVAVAGIDAHEQAVSDKADTAIAEIVDTTDSVTTAKQSALTSITQATSDVTDASTQFIADLADTQSTIDAQVTQAQDSLQEVSDTLTAVNDKAATVNDTADAFTADVADKSQLVEDKYQQFDDNVTEANCNLDAILGLVENADVKIKNEIVNGDFSRGTMGWLSHSDRGVLSTSDKILRNTGNGTNVNVISKVKTKIPFVIGREIYIKAKARVTNGICKELRSTITNAGFSGSIILLSQPLPVENQWYTVSVVDTPTFNLDTAQLNFYQVYETASDSNNSVLEIDGNYGVLAVDLTKTFGEGNEPTKEEMDTLINLLGGWFDGEITLTQMQQLNWLLKLIRQNALATTALGGTIL